MPYIIDADWVIEVTRRNPYIANVVKNLAAERVVLSWVTLGEVYEAAFNTSHPQAQIREFHRYLTTFAMLGMDGAIMERFAEIRSFLRRRGQMISDFDIILAATALHHDLTVLTFNTRHLERVPDLRICQPG